MHNYSKEDFIKSLQKAGIEYGDTLFGHSNIGFFGRLEFAKNAQETCNLLLESIFSVIGSEGTLLLPTFSYSFSNKKSFNPKTTKGVGGIFSEYIRNLPQSRRSLDPSVSITAIGGKCEIFTSNMPVEVYGSKGFFGRLLKENVKTLNMNIDSATTFVHYAEKLLKVPYRFTKKFSGTIILNSKSYQSESHLWVRYRHPATSPRFENFDNLALKMNLVKKLNIGRGFISVMNISDQLRVVREGIDSDPWFMTCASEINEFPTIDEMINAEYIYSESKPSQNE